MGVGGGKGEPDFISQRRGHKVPPSPPSPADPSLPTLVECSWPSFGLGGIVLMPRVEQGWLPLPASWPLCPGRGCALWPLWQKRRVQPPRMVVVIDGALRAPGMEYAIYNSSPTAMWGNRGLARRGQY